MKHIGCGDKMKKISSLQIEAGDRILHVSKHDKKENVEAPEVEEEVIKDEWIS